MRPDIPDHLQAVTEDARQRYAQQGAPRVLPALAPADVRLRERKIILAPLRQSLSKLANPDGMIPVSVLLELLDRLEQTP